MCHLPQAQELKTSTLFDFFVLFPQAQGAYGMIQGCQNSMRHIIFGVARKVHSFTTLCCTLWVAFYWVQELKTSTLFDFFVLFPQAQGAYGMIQGCQNSMRHIIFGVARKVHSFTTLCCTLWVAFSWVLILLWSYFHLTGAAIMRLQMRRNAAECG